MQIKFYKFCAIKPANTTTSEENIKQTNKVCQKQTSKNFHLSKDSLFL